MAHIRGIALAIAVLALSSTTVQADGDHNAPDFGSESTTMSVPENSPSNTVVGRVSAGHHHGPTKLDRRPRHQEEDAILYRLKGKDSNSFHIGLFLGTIWTKEEEYVNGSEYSVTVRAENGKGESDEIAVTILVIEEEDHLNVMGEDESSDNSEADESSQQGRSEESSDDSGAGGDTPQEESEESSDDSGAGGDTPQEESEESSDDSGAGGDTPQEESEESSDDSGAGGDTPQAKSEESSDDSGAGGDTPAKPTGLSAEVSHDSVTLTWDAPQDDSITGYVILRRNRDTDAQGQFTELVADTGSAATGYTDGSVAAGTPYTYRIKAINAHGSSERSRWFHVDTPSVPVPDKPTGLTATASHDQVVLTWDDPGDDSITGYVILRRNRDTDAEGQFTELVNDTGSAATTYTDDSMAAETPYTYRIKAINDQGVSERSRWFHIDTPASPTPESDPALLAPANLTATTADGQVVLSWDAPIEDTGSVTGYEILRGQGEDDPTTLVADTGIATTTYTDETATQASTVYAYRVKAIRDGDLSQASNKARVHLPPAAPPQVLSAASYDSVLLSWDDPDDDTITGYRIMRADIVDQVQGEFAVLNQDTGSADTTYTDDTVEPERSYVYRVLVISPHGVSAPSHDVEAHTPADPNPAVPEREGVQDLGDITEQDGPQFNRGALEGAAGRGALLPLHPE